MCKTRTLSTSNEAVLSQCASCKTIYLWFKSTLQTFSPSEFIDFRQAVNQMSFTSCAVMFPDNASRIIVRTKSKDVSFAFNQEEWQDFYNIVNEAHYMQEIYDMLEKTDHK